MGISGTWEFRGRTPNSPQKAPLFEPFSSEFGVRPRNSRNSPVPEIPAHKSRPNLDSSAFLIRRKAIEQPSATRTDQRHLTATPTRMRRVPGSVAAAGPVVMTQLCGALIVARPVAAGVIHTVGVGFSVGR